MRILSVDAHIMRICAYPSKKGGGAGGPEAWGTVTSGSLEDGHSPGACEGRREGGAWGTVTSPCPKTL